MCFFFFFSCTPWHKPIPYFKGACNKFDFGLILKRKKSIVIAMVLARQSFFKNDQNHYFLVVSTPGTCHDGKFLNPDMCSARKMPSETPGAILFAKLLQGCVLFQASSSDLRFVMPNWLKISKNRMHNLNCQFTG